MTTLNREVCLPWSSQDDLFLQTSGDLYNAAFKGVPIGDKVITDHIMFK